MSDEGDGKGKNDQDEYVYLYDEESAERPKIPNGKGQKTRMI